MEQDHYINWEDNELPSYVSWLDYIPPPTYMVKPEESWRETCIGHAYAECLTSRRRIVAAANGDPVDHISDVSISLLVRELIRSKCITKDGGKPKDISLYICKNGAPLVRQTERACITGFNIAKLTNLQDVMVFDLPDELNAVEFVNVLNQKEYLLSEINLNGPVIGLFNADTQWPHANGEIYYDECAYLVSRAEEDVLFLGPHAAQVYGFDNATSDPFDVDLLLQDSMGPAAHTNGRARMNISSLRGYIVPYVNDDLSEGHSSVGAFVREAERVKYDGSCMKGWGDNVEDILAAFPDLDDSISSFGV